MAEDEQLFDLSLKKKKKKKKMPFDMEAALTGEVPEDNNQMENDDDNETKKEETTISKTDELSLDDDFSSLVKKKKKKKKTFDLSELDDAIPKKEESIPEIDAVLEVEESGEMDVDISDFSLPSKKKKKKKVKIIEGEVEMKEDAEEGQETSGPAVKGSEWADTDRDYTYDELLDRVFTIMREKNPDMVAGEKKRFVMKPPQVVRAGAKKSSFNNFNEICKMLHRQPKHLLAFLLAELGTSGSIDGNNCLIIKGKYQQKQIESVLRRYIKEYVTCHTCRSPETFLQKDTRLYFLQCETCGSRCSVASIKSGFQAVTGKRAAIRAKTA